MRSVYILLGSWDYEGDTVVGVFATLREAVRAFDDYNPSTHWVDRVSVIRHRLGRKYVGHPGVELRSKRR